MILVVKPQTPEDALHHLIKDIEATGLHTHLSRGEEVTIIGLIGDKTKIDLTAIESNPIVDKIDPGHGKLQTCQQKVSSTANRICCRKTPKSVQTTSRSCPVLVPWNPKNNCLRSPEP